MACWGGDLARLGRQTSSATWPAASAAVGSRTGGREKREKGGQTAFFLKKKVLNLKFDENKMEELFKTYNFHFR